MQESTANQRLVRWQWITLGTLLVGYAGYYVCRSNLSVATPSILQEFGSQGWDKRTLGTIVSAGVFVYALGKIANGLLADFISSRLIFLLGMLISAICTVAFGLGTTFGVLLFAWSSNRFVQSAGWGALVKLASRWFPSERHGSVMGVLCLSYLFGDALARLALGATIWFFGWLRTNGPGEYWPAAATDFLPWRWMFLVAAAVLAAIAAVSWVLLKESPVDVGAVEPPANPRNVFGPQGNQAKPQKLAELLWPLLSSLSFWLVLVMSLGLTLVRETFNTWTPTYLTEVCRLSVSAAGMSSAIIPLVGGVPALLAGLLADRLAARGRGVIMFTSLGLMSLSLGALTRVPAGTAAWIPIALMCSGFFFLIGPYTFLTGVLSLEFGGKRGSATAAGLTDAAGYLGAVLSGRWIGGIAQDHGWTPAFGVLAVCALVTTLAALLYWIWHDLRLGRAPRER